MSPYKYYTINRSTNSNGSSENVDHSAEKEFTDVVDINRSETTVSSEQQQELDAAIDKISQLRQIIRLLEAEAESQAESERLRCAELDELRSALADSLLTQQAVQHELENLRRTSTDKEMIDLIEGLKEQLSSKSQELHTHRAANQHLHDVKVGDVFSLF